MSQYANYTAASQNYDTTRISVGVDTILGCFAHNRVPLEEQTVLDAGCGTGNYLQALHRHVGCVVGIDLSEGMLAQARAKLGDDIELSCGAITNMSYNDERFDGVTCNQVIHHLDEGPGAAVDPTAWNADGFPNVSRFICEAYRVLKPGGALIINVTTHTQFRDGYWWAELIPTAVERMICRLPDLDQLTQMFAEAGFEIESISADSDGILQGTSYLNPLGPLSESWRAGDSTWSLASDAELAAAMERVTQMDRQRTMNDWLADREHKRLSVGQSTLVCGRK